MRKIITYSLYTMLFVLVNISYVQSQVQVIGTASMLNQLRLNESINKVNGINYSDIDGDPYLFKHFEEGRVTMKNGDIFKSNLRFDIHASEMQFRIKENIYALTKQDDIQSIEIGTMKFLYSNYQSSKAGNKQPVYSYFEVVREGAVKLLEKKNIRIQDPEPPKLYQEAKPAKFIIKDETFFLKSGDLPAVKIKSQKDIKSFFAGNAKVSEITSFLKKEKLNCNKKDDLIQIVDFVNQLSE